jgi:hypothetical protein
MKMEHRHLTLKPAPTDLETSGLFLRIEIHRSGTGSAGIPFISRDLRTTQANREVCLWRLGPCDHRLRRRRRRSGEDQGRGDGGQRSQTHFRSPERPRAFPVPHRGAIPDRADHPGVPFSSAAVQLASGQPRSPWNDHLVDYEVRPSSA